MKFFAKMPAYDLATSGIPLVPTKDLSPDQGAFDSFAVLEQLRAAIARHNDVGADEVAAAMGTSHAVFLAYAALCSPGDEIVLESPVYEPLVRAAEGLGIGVRTFERPEVEDFRVAPDRVAAAMSPRTRAIVVTNLHNPSGARVPDDTLRALAAIAEARGAYLVVDEVYAAFVDLPEDGVFRASARRLAPNVVAVSSLTKCYGLGRHRIGWVLGPPDVAERAASATMATMGHYPTPYAAYAVEAFTHVGRLARRAKTIIGDKRRIAGEWARSLRGARWSAPEAGLYGLVTLAGRGDLTPAIERLASEASVLVAPGAFFGLPESFRLSWASCDEKDFREGLRRLEALV
jgi:aspartate/methionine/tyrosine aminotransferase